jgi:hypothetical protein
MDNQITEIRVASPALAVIHALNVDAAPLHRDPFYGLPRQSWPLYPEPFAIEAHGTLHQLQSAQLGSYLQIHERRRAMYSIVADEFGSTWDTAWLGLPRPIFTDSHGWDGDPRFQLTLVTAALATARAIQAHRPVGAAFDADAAAGGVALLLQLAVCDISHALRVHLKEVEPAVARAFATGRRAEAYHWVVALAPTTAGWASLDTGLFSTVEYGADPALRDTLRAPTLRGTALDVCVRQYAQDITHFMDLASPKRAHTAFSLDAEDLSANIMHDIVLVPDYDR